MEDLDRVVGAKCILFSFFGPSFGCFFQVYTRLRCSGGKDFGKDLLCDGGNGYQREIDFVKAFFIWPPICHMFPWSGKSYIGEAWEALLCGERRALKKPSPCQLFYCRLGYKFGS